MTNNDDRDDKKVELAAVPNVPRDPNARTNDDAVSDANDGGVGQRLANGFEVPINYELWADGLYRIEDFDNLGGGRPTLLSTPPPQRRRAGLKRVCRGPIWINQFGRARDTGEELIELVHIDRATDKQASTWVTRGAMASRRDLAALANNGLPIHDGSANDVMLYLDSAYHVNANVLPRIDVATRCGSYDVEIVDRTNRIPTRRTTPGWLYGNKWIGPANTSIELDTRFKNSVADALRRGNDNPEACIDFWVGVTDKQRPENRESIVRWLLNSTFAAPLMKLLNTRTFIIHHWAPTGTGKTALLRLAQSAWGDPQVLTYHFNRTAISFTELFNYIDDYPVAFDELQSARKGDDLAQLIYALCLERGRARATKSGKLEAETLQWRVLVRTTGEEPIIGKDSSVDIGGQTNRVIQLDTPLLDDAESRDIYRWVDGGNFGCLAEIFLRYLLKILEPQEGIIALRELFNEVRNKIRDRSDAMVASRIDHLAIVAVASYIARRAMLPAADRDFLLAQAIDDACVIAQLILAEELIQREPIAHRAMQLLRDSFFTQRGRWLDVTNPAEARKLTTDHYSNGLIGVLTEDEVWMIPTVVAEILRRAGMPEKKIVTDLKRDGTLITVGPGRTHGNQANRKFGTRYQRVYVFDRAIFDVMPDPID